MSSVIELLVIGKDAYPDSQQDGIMEVVMGIFLITITVPLTNPKFALIYVILMLLLIMVTERLRRRYTYPRIGYVKLYMDPPQGTMRCIFTCIIVTIVVITIASFIISGDITSFERCYKWSPAFSGLMIVGAFLYTASKSERARFHAFAVVSAVLGFVLSIADFDSEHNYIGLIIYLLVMGGFLVISGIVVFRLFLRRYPLPEKEVYDVSGN
jgi:hypothetical protein